jgi:hypothetical protein
MSDRTSISTTRQKSQSNPEVGPRLVELLDRGGIAAAHFASRGTADLKGLLSQQPGRVASLTVLCPAVLDTLTDLARRSVPGKRHQGRRAAKEAMALLEVRTGLAAGGSRIRTSGPAWLDQGLKTAFVSPLLILPPTRNNRHETREPTPATTSGVFRGTKSSNPASSSSESDANRFSGAHPPIAITELAVAQNRSSSFDATTISPSFTAAGGSRQRVIPSLPMM